ncbi:MAG: SGNH/GDSL hydrolase family protein [Limisphaerales bacterium]
MSAKSTRLKGILIAGIVLLGIIFYYLSVYFVHPVGHGPAGPPVSRSAFSRPWTDRPVLLVGLGDSVTAGFGARKGYSYFDRLITNPPDEFADLSGICLHAVMPKLQFTNLAISGSTSLEHLEKELPRLTVAGPDVLGIVVFTTGGNDLIHNYGRTPPRNQAMYGASLQQAKPWIEDFDRRLNLMINEITTRFPGGCQIFLADIYDPTDGAGDIQHTTLPGWPDGLKILSAYNEIIQACARSHTNVHRVNLHDAFLGHGIHCAQFWTKHYDWKDPHYWYFINLEDPNERGYDALRRLFLNEMAACTNQLK